MTGIVDPYRRSTVTPRAERESPLVTSQIIRREQAGPNLVHCHLHRQEVVDVLGD
jgi:hypothetical protein